MPLKTKIVLSDKELALVKNEDWILTKQRVIQKVYEIFNQSISAIDESIPWRAGLVSEIPVEPPKIYKGENYLGLPYVSLDHPRFFQKEDVFAVRTMFWWGNFFSITFHVAGIYKEIFAGRILESLKEDPADLYMCINSEQWHHHFKNDNYVRVDDLSHKEAETLLINKKFIKLALKYDLDQFNNISELLADGYKKIGDLF